MSNHIQPLSLPVRYFIFSYDVDPENVIEATEQEFLEASGEITYERHTVFANGVSQVCLTKGLPE
jgi:hypothetical protein